MNLQNKGAKIALVTTAVAAGGTLVVTSIEPLMTRFSSGDFNWFSAIKFSSVIVGASAVIYFIATKKLLHLEVIEVGEMGFRTCYGQPICHKWGERKGTVKVYYPGDKVVIIPIIVDIVIVSTRKRITTTRCEGVFAGKNIRFDLSIDWYVLGDVESAFKAAFSLHDAVRDNEKSATLDDLVVNRTLRLVDSSLASLSKDSNDLPDLSGLKLYPGPLLEVIEEHGTYVGSVVAMNRIIAPEERQKQGLQGIQVHLGEVV